MNTPTRLRLHRKHSIKQQPPTHWREYFFGLLFIEMLPGAPRHTTKKYFNCVCTSVSAFSRDCLRTAPADFPLLCCFPLLLLLLLFLVIFFGENPANQCRQQINDNGIMEGHIERATNGVWKCIFCLLLAAAEGFWRWKMKFWHEGYD